MTRLSLRLRIFLFFALIAAMGILGFGAGLYVAFTRAEAAMDVSPLIQAGIIGSIILLAVVAGVWLLFDENVARPLTALANDIRSRAHSGLDKEIDPEVARYLGDIAPAAQAIAANLRESREATDRAIREKSAQVAQERSRFATILRDAPVGVILCTRAHRIALYNAEAVAQFGCDEGDLGLHRSIFDLFPEGDLRGAMERLDAGESDVSLVCNCANSPAVEMRISAIHADEDEELDGYLIATRPVEAARAAAVPAQNRCVDFYDFGLLSPRPSREDAGKALGEIDYVVFDTETTGLEPQKGDEVVQIAGVRIVNNRIVRGEEFDRLVDPERSIPAASTEVHHISEDMVRGAPSIDIVARQFHRYCRDCVLIAHNAPFDLSFFRKHETRIGARFDHPVLDTVLLSAIVYGTDAEHSLDALADRLDVTIPAELRHTALGDSVATAECFLKLVPLLEVAGVRTLGEAVTAENDIRGAVGMAALPQSPPPKLAGGRKDRALAV